MFSIEPQFFDIFGFLGFVYIAILAFFLLRGVVVPKWTLAVLFLIGILGILIDGTIVYTSYLK